MIKINVFGWRLFVRVLVLLGVCLLTGFIFLSPEWIFTQIILFALIVLLTLDINHYIHKTNRNVSRLLESLLYEEYAVTFIDHKKTSRYSDLDQKMEEIKLQHQSKTKNLEQKIALYEKTLNQIEYGALLYNQNNKILIQSSNLSTLLNVPAIKNMAALDRFLPGFQKKVAALSDHAYLSLNEDENGKILPKRIVLEVTKFKQDGIPHTLLIFSSREGAHTDRDLEAWVNFGKVISHEILNGISPFIALTNTMQGQLDKMEGNERLKTSMQKALDILIERTESLLKYSEKYRTLHRLPEPNVAYLQWSEVINASIDMHQELLDTNKIKVSIEGTALNNSFKADRWQMDQVFTNLLLNSVHAFAESDNQQNTITILVDEDPLNYIVRFSDNGPGIDKNNRANVFVPFFSTRESGSGIGLSVIKQILWKHNAQIFLSEWTMGASFTIRFPKI